MTCPCGHYDYLDSTAETLADAMTCKYHLHLNDNYILIMQIIDNMAIELYMKS
jgi:plasmid maintenance system killer protein